MSAIVDPGVGEAEAAMIELVLSLLDFARADLRRFVLLPPGSDLEGEPFCFLFGPIWAATCQDCNSNILQYRTH